MTTEPIAPAEEAVLRAAAEAWIDGIPVVAPPMRPPAPLRPLVATAGALALFAAAIVLAFLVPLGEEEAEPVTLRVEAAPAPGIFAPPSLDQVLLITETAVEVKVRAASPGKLDADVVEIIHGDRTGIPSRFTLRVPPAVSELEAEEVKAKAGERLILLLRREDGALRLTTRNPWSIVGARSTCFLWTTDLHEKTYDERRAMVVATLALRDLLRETKWEKQGPHLIVALRSGDPLRREFAIDWYRMYRKGWPPDDLSLVPEQKEKKPALPEFDDALVPFLLPREDAISTLAGSVADVLTLHPAARWAPDLDRLARAEAIVLLFREMEKHEYRSRREEIVAALEKEAESGSPAGRYLALSLLRRADAARAMDLPEEARTALAAFKHVPAWPPERLAAWLAEED